MVVKEATAVTDASFNHARRSTICPKSWHPGSDQLFSPQHYSEAPSFEELQKAAREAVRRAAQQVEGLRQAAAGTAAEQQDAKQT